MDALIGKIVDGSATIGVVGFGYVGLPLTLAFAEARFGTSMMREKLDPDVWEVLDAAARFIDLADEINTSMPAAWGRTVQDALNDAGKPLKGSKVLVLGVAYKPDISDRGVCRAASPAPEGDHAAAGGEGSVGAVPRSARAEPPARGAGFRQRGLAG